MISTRWMLLAALAAPVLVSTPALAQSSGDDLRPAVETMLGGYEAPAATDADWVTLGPQAVPHLLAIAGDETRRTSERARAISALGNFATDDVKVYLTTVLTEQAHNSLQRNALRSLARTGGAERLALIASFLAHEDSTLREASAHALGLVGTDEAHAALQARRAAETSEAVIAAIDEELAR